LVKQFDAQTGYTHSDEITLIFNSKCREDEYLEYLEKQSKNLLTKDDKSLPIHMFNGRIQKILSLVSSYCSVRFNYHLVKLIEPIKETYDLKFVEIIESMNAMFDGRILIFQEANKYEILNHQIWRSIHDCSRNAVSTYAYTYFGPKKIMNKDTRQMIQMMLDEKGLNWNDSAQVPTFIKHGLYCKKIMVNKVIDGNTALRAEYIFKQYKIDFSQENLDILLAKYWNDVESWDSRVNLNELVI
jgi:tRNA(His) guanylyltransferase